MVDELRKKIRNVIVDYCESNYFEKDEHGYYKYELYADYRDEIDCKTAAEICEAVEPLRKLYDMVDDWWFDCVYECENEHIEKIKNSILEVDGELFPDGMTDCDEEMLRDEFRDIVYIEPPYDHYLKQSFHTNIMVDTGDGNYDYTLNAVYPAYGGIYGDTINNKASIVWLAKQQGYTKTQLKKALNLGDMREPKGLLQTLRVEIANEASHMNTLCFLAKMTLEELIKVNELIRFRDKDGVMYDAKERKYCGYLVIDKKAETGLYDPWNGGGSLFEIELEKDIRLPIKFIRSALPDGGDGWSLDSVYGMCGSCWREDVVKKIHAPVNLNKEMA